MMGMPRCFWISSRTGKSLKPGRLEEPMIDSGIDIDEARNADAHAAQQHGIQAVAHFGDGADDFATT